jgi:glycosyltransferase involved in cell wall biosynthesis
MTVSVVIPCYNRASILGRSLRSALAQTVVPDEIIVVDDGSRDGSADVARSFGDRVRVIEQPNAGAAAARNRGIVAARGDWIAFLDSDDEWDATKLERQLAAAARYPQARLIFCDTQVRTENNVVMASRFALGGLRGVEINKDGDDAAYDRSLFRRMLTQSRVITSAVMVRRELPELKFPEHIWGSEDWALWLTLALRYPFASVDALLVTMHQQGDNISARKGRLYRNDVKVLEELAEDPSITPAERDAIVDEASRRRIGAVYHSLLRGEGLEARQLLAKIKTADLGWRRSRVYLLLSYCPSVLLWWICRAFRQYDVLD